MSTHDVRSVRTPITVHAEDRHLGCEVPELDLVLDLGRLGIVEDYLARIDPAMRAALQAMARLEAGAMANADEQQRVGHYWLRAPELAPDPLTSEAIDRARSAVLGFADQVRRGVVRGAGGRFEHLVHIGIGGSTTGPQLVCDALGAGDGLRVHFLDNADPDGIDRLMAALDGALGRTLVSVVSKCGWTPTPAHVLAEVEARYRAAGLEFARHAVATTLARTGLDERARAERWLARFPIWDWVGGRTSVTSAVGLLPAALCGVDASGLLEGARAMDRATRDPNPRTNPAALLATAWHWCGHGRGEKAMVVLPYKDRLALLGRYVQQLVMESVGKRTDRAGNLVEQGLTVYGWKGSTDQHAYFQQLREGANDFFATLLYFRDSRTGPSIEVAPGLTLGDHLHGYFEGTAEALSARGRDVITLSTGPVSARTLGAVIALYERAVGLYCELLDLNAYHQPGIDKSAAARVVELQVLAVEHLRSADGPLTASEVASGIGRPEATELVRRLLRRLAAEPGRDVVCSANEQFSVRSAEADDRPIVMSEELFDRLVATITARFPRKSFGYLISSVDARTPTDFILFEGNIRNDADWQPEFHAHGRYFVEHDDAGFVATPEESWRVQKQIWDRGMFEVGVFHNHQRHPANFSGIDHELHLTRVADLWHLVVSLRNPELPQVRGYQPAGGRVREVPVHVTRGEKVARSSRNTALDPLLERARTVLRLDDRGAPLCRDSAAVLDAVHRLWRTGREDLIGELLVDGFLRGADQRRAELVADGLVDIAGGRFDMGTDPAQARHFCGETPRHAVELPGFAIGRFAVTNRLYAAFDPSRAVPEAELDLPVVSVSWFDAALLAMWLGCRLPTEAEWELACGAGSTGEWCCERESDLPVHAWFSENSGGTLHPVGRREPNAFGLFDLHGNVWEWCQDDHDQDYYARSPVLDPVLRDFGCGVHTNKICRGGSMHALSEMCRTSHRFYEPVSYQAADLGLRLAASLGGT